MGLSLKKLVKGVADFQRRNVKTVGRVVAAATPFDEMARGTGRVAQTVARRAPEVPASSPARFLNNAAIRPYKTTMGNAGQALQGQNPYTGNLRQQSGQFLQDVVNVGSVAPVGRAVSLAAKSTTPLRNRVAQEALFNAKVGAGFGAAQGVATANKENMSIKDTAKTIGLNTAIGTAAGGALGGAIPLAGAGTKAVIKNAPAVANKVDKAVMTPQSQRVGPETKRQLADWADYKMKRYKAGADDFTKLDANARKLTKQTGVDFINGPPATIDRKVAEFLDPTFDSGHLNIGALVPEGKPKVSTKPVKPADPLEAAIFGDRAPAQFKTRQLGQLSEKLSPNRQLRKVTRKVENVASDVIDASLESGSRTLRTPGRLAVGVSRQLGKSPEELARLAQYQGGKELGDVYGKRIKAMGDDAIKAGVRRDAVADALDPDLAAAQGRTAPKLTPEEQVEVGKLREIMDVTHEMNKPLLDPKVYEANKGTYFPRDFTEFFDEGASNQIAKQYKLDLNPFKHRKDLSDIPKEVLDAAQKDPYYLAALSVQKTQRNVEFARYADWLSENGSISPGPRKGYIEVPDTPAYGALRGKHVLKEQLEDMQGFIYETETAQHAIALLNAYDRLPPRRARKAMLTIYNPGVRLGNRTFNYLITSLNGINPVTFTRNYARARSMMKNDSPEYIEATKQGIFGSTIIDKELYKGNQLKPTSKNPAKNAHRIVAETYSKVDDEAKLSAYITFRERGLDPAEAAQRTSRITQNYDMVGQLFDIGSKTPVGGNAFIRFASELMRIAHNTAVDNPLRAASAGVAVTTLVELSSRLSGESPEDRKTREERVGAPRIPFTEQSLEFQTPWGAVNAGRLLGITTYNDLAGGLGEDVKRLTPFQVPVTKDDSGFHLNAAAVTSDPLVGPVIAQVIDKDFRGKPITDPDREKFPSQPLSSEQQKKNRLKQLGMSYVPYANEANSIASAAENKPNYYNKERSVPQALLRAGGIKVEQFGKKQAEAQRGRDEYFSGEYERAQTFLKENPDLAERYNKFKGREKVRSGPDKGKKLADYVTPEKWQQVSSDTSGRLYDFLKSEALKSNKKDGSPIDPVYKLPTSEQTKAVLELRSRPTGDDIETEEILRATSSWYKNFESAERDYYDANTKYFEGKGLKDTSGPRAKAYSEVKNPEQSPLAQQYYKLRYGDPENGVAGNDQAGKDFFKANADKLSADFNTYKQQRLGYINAKRKIEGFDPISSSAFNNVTFGYEDDERKVYNELKYGKGFGGSFGGGGGSGGGGGRSKGSNPLKYAISLNTGKSSVKPKVSKVEAKNQTSQKSVVDKTKFRVKARKA